MKINVNLYQEMFSEDRPTKLILLWKEKGLENMLSYQLRGDA